MIFQAYQTIEQVNGTGINGVLQTASTAVPSLPALILTSIFIVIAYVSFFSTQRRTGRGDFWASCAVAGFVAVVIGFVMTLIPNFITNTTLVPAVALEIVFVVILFFSGSD